MKSEISGTLIKDIKNIKVYQGISGIFKMSGMLRYIREIRNIMNNTYIKDIKGYQDISRDMKDISQF